MLSFEMLSGWRPSVKCFAYIISNAQIGKSRQERYGSQNMYVEGLGFEPGYFSKGLSP